MSYMMKKSLADEMRKSLDPKMLYFKKKILDHLKKLAKKEDKEKSSLKKSLLIAETMAKGGAGLPVGTIRVWKGKKYIKIAPGKWKPKYDSNTRGAKMAIAALKKKLEACETSEEMLQLVLANRSRFSDEVTGRPLPFVQELADYVSSLNDKKEKKPGKNKEVKATVTDSQTNERVISEYLGDKKGVGDRIKEGNKETIFGNDYSKKHRLEFKMNVMGSILGKPQMDQALFDELSQYSMGSDSHKLAPKYGLRGEEFLALVNKVKENRVTIVNAEESEQEKQKNKTGEKKDSEKAKKEDGHYWIQDSKGDRLTNIDAKKRIKQNLSQINSFNELMEGRSKADNLRMESAKRSLEYDNNRLMERLNSEDREEMKTEFDKYQNRSNAMKGNQNAKKYGASMDDKEPIAKATKVADGKVTIPNEPEIKNQMKQLIASRYTDTNGSPSYIKMLSEVYYDGENLVSTDAKILKVIKVGKLDGIEPNKYVKIDISGKDNISINQMDKEVGQYPNYKRVLPDNNNQTFAIDNKLAKEKLEAMKRDGAIPKNGYVALEFVGDAIKVDGTIIGKTYGTKFDTDHLTIQADYILNLLGKNGEETNFNASDSSKKAITVTTNVSTDVIMPMTNAGIPDYEQNRKDFKEREEFAAERKAESERKKEEQESRKLNPEIKELLLKNKPEGVSADDYNAMIDYADNFYVKLGYDNTQQMAGANIKRMIDSAINQINNKDYGFEEVLLNSDNKVSRKVFEMLTGERVGTNKQATQRAWESWVGKEGVDAHNKKIADDKKAKEDRIAAEKKAKEDAEREQYHGFMDGKTPAGKGKAKDILEKKGNFNGNIMTFQELADKYIAEGGRASKQTYVTGGGKEKNYYYVVNKDGSGYEVPKTIYDYANHISENPVKKSIPNNVVMLNEYEHDDFENQERISKSVADVLKLF